MSQESPNKDQQVDVQMQWGVTIPMRDGTRLNGTLYLPEQHCEPSPVVFTLTPYISQNYHDAAIYFAERGLPFLTVDVRGRGNSEGVFHPLFQEAQDGYDIVEWLARQPYCSGKVGMWGLSYGGYDQWATVKGAPPHLATIVPVAALYIGVDFPLRHNIFPSYLIQWLTLVAGHTAQDKIFQHQFWSRKFQRWYESGAPFNELDAHMGSRSAIFQEWISHPHQDEYWDRCNPTSEEYARLRIPILTITGSYDSDQPGALTHYREHLRSVPEERGMPEHYLVIGPWDHVGTRFPKTEFGGIKVGAESLLDLQKLHFQWYSWTMAGGPKPEFLRNKVAYYVIGADKWRYAENLEDVTDHVDAYYLSAPGGNADDVFHSGIMGTELPFSSGPSYYVYDPTDVSGAAFEATIELSYSDQQLIHRSVGKQLIYHTAPFERETEVSGVFRLRVWLSIDKPDTDFDVAVHEVRPDGNSVLLSSDWIRARYRQSLRQATLICTTDPLPYDFDRFTFTSRVITKGSRLRLVIGPVNSIHVGRNFNAGGTVAKESIQVGGPVNVKLYHDREHPSVLHVPIGRPSSPKEPSAPPTSLISV